VSENFQCPNCGAAIDYNPGDDPVIPCPYCRTSVVVPERFLKTTSRSSLVSNLPANLLQPANIARLDEISRLARSGDKIEAIKLYRQVFGVGLKEAKDAVEQIAAGEPIVLSSSSTVEYSTTDLESELRQLLAQDDRLGAVKRYHELTGSGLKAAQEAVDALATTGSLPGMSFHLHGDASLDQAEAMRWAYATIEVIDLVKSGEMDAAIQRYQDTMGVSYSEAQEAVHNIALGITRQPSSSATVVTLPPEAAATAVKTTAGVVGGISCLSLGVTLVLILFTLGIVLFAFTSPGGPLEGVWNRVNPLAYARLTLAFGEQGSGAGTFDDPRTIAVDLAGNVFVGEYSDGRVQKFDSNGAYQMLWNIGPEQYLQAMAAAPSGEVHLVYRGDIWQYDGATGQPLGALPNPEDRWFETVAVGADGSLVTAINSEDILRYDPYGNLVFSMQQSGLNQTGDPEGAESLALDGLGNIYLLTDEDAVIRYAPDGRLLGRFGSDGDEPGQFTAPSAIAVDGQGRIYVSDMKGIQVFANDGRYLDKIEVEGYAFGLAFDQQGNLWAATNLPKVLKYKIIER
jgi:ribosomal protein L7/L12/DNA-binding beta-propeller fold protein YncE